MRKGIFGSIVTLLTSAGLSYAEPPLALAPATQLPAVTTSGQAAKGQQPEATPCPTVEYCPESCDKDCGVWLNMDYLMWWIKDSPMPVPIVTTGPTGIIGATGTQVLLGGKDIEGQTRHGGRLTLGCWLNEERTVGIEASGFFLDRSEVDETVSRTGLGNPPFFLPFVDATTGQEVVLSGSTADSAIAQISHLATLYGGEANGIFKVSSGDCWCVSVLAGFRYMELDEKLRLFFGSEEADTGRRTTFTDQFNTYNKFFGGQIGARLDYTMGKFFMTATGKVALGDMYQAVDINGTTATVLPGGTPSTFPGGIFTQGTNIGRHHQNKFAVIPEVTINVGCQFTDYCRGFVGYNFLYLSNVLRPGDQIDRTLNLSQSPFLGTGTLVGPARPQVEFNDSDFWAQGLNFGLEFRF